MVLSFRKREKKKEPIIPVKNEAQGFFYLPPRIGHQRHLTSLSLQLRSPPVAKATSALPRASLARVLYSDFFDHRSTNVIATHYQTLQQDHHCRFIAPTSLPDNHLRLNLTTSLDIASQNLLYLCRSISSMIPKNSY